MNPISIITQLTNKFLNRAGRKVSAAAAATTKSYGVGEIVLPPSGWDHGGGERGDSRSILWCFKDKWDRHLKINLAYKTYQRTKPICDFYLEL